MSYENKTPGIAGISDGLIVVRASTCWKKDSLIGTVYQVNQSMATIYDVDTVPYSKLIIEATGAGMITFENGQSFTIDNSNYEQVVFDVSWTENPYLRIFIQDSSVNKSNEFSKPNVKAIYIKNIWLKK